MDSQVLLRVEHLTKHFPAKGGKVLRAVEDRGLAPGLTSLRTTVTKEGAIDLAELAALFQAARKKIQTELFDVPPPPGVPAFVLAGIIQDLYEPRGLPIRGFRYNFKWISADVLGRAYERYLSTVLIPSRKRQHQLELFAAPRREVERFTRRKAGGAGCHPRCPQRCRHHRHLRTAGRHRCCRSRPALRSSPGYSYS